MYLFECCDPELLGCLENRIHPYKILTTNQVVEVQPDLLLWVVFTEKNEQNIWAPQNLLLAFGFFTCTHPSSLGKILIHHFSPRASMVTSLWKPGTPSKPKGMELVKIIGTSYQNILSSAFPGRCICK